MIKNILLTGSKGQLGSEIIRKAPFFPDFSIFPTDVDTLDICNKTAVENFITDNNIDCIINCAAYTAVDKAESDVERCFVINRDAVRNLAESASGKAKIIHISTDYVFDGNGDRPLRETDPVSPQSVYGASKLAGEQALLDIMHDDCIIIRTSWLYSAFGNNFVKTMLRLGRERETLSVVNDQRGTPTWAGDLAAIIMKIIYLKAVDWDFFHTESQVFHFSNEGECTWYEFCLKIFELSGIDSCKVSPVGTDGYPTAARRPKYSVLDKTKICNTFGIEIPQWENSLKQCLKEIGAKV